MSIFSCAYWPSVCLLYPMNFLFHILQFLFLIFTIGSFFSFLISLETPIFLLIISIFPYILLNIFILLILKSFSVNSNIWGNHSFVSIDFSPLDYGSCFSSFVCLVNLDSVSDIVDTVLQRLWILSSSSEERWTWCWQAGGWDHFEPGGLGSRLAIVALFCP